MKPNSDSSHLTSRVGEINTPALLELADELDGMAERITRYSNGPGDGLCSAAAEALRTLLAATPDAGANTVKGETA